MYFNLQIFYFIIKIIYSYYIKQIVYKLNLYLDLCITYTEIY